MVLSPNRSASSTARQPLALRRIRPDGGLQRRTGGEQVPLAQRESPAEASCLPPWPPNPPAV